MRKRILDFDLIEAKYGMATAVSMVLFIVLLHVGLYLGSWLLFATLFGFWGFMFALFMPLIGFVIYGPVRVFWGIYKERTTE